MAVSRTFSKALLVLLVADTSVVVLAARGDSEENVPPTGARTGITLSPRGQQQVQNSTQMPGQWQWVPAGDQSTGLDGADPTDLPQKKPTTGTQTASDAAQKKTVPGEQARSFSYRQTLHPDQQRELDSYEERDDETTYHQDSRDPPPDFFNTAADTKKKPDVVDHSFQPGNVQPHVPSKAGPIGTSVQNPAGVQSNGERQMPLQMPPMELHNSMGEYHSYQPMPPTFQQRSFEPQHAPEKQSTNSKIQEQRFQPDQVHPMAAKGSDDKGQAGKQATGSKAPEQHLEHAQPVEQHPDHPMEQPPMDMAGYPWGHPDMQFHSFVPVGQYPPGFEPWQYQAAPMYPGWPPMPPGFQQNGFEQPQQHPSVQHDAFEPPQFQGSQATGPNVQEQRKETGQQTPTEKHEEKQAMAPKFQEQSYHPAQKPLEAPSTKATTVETKAATVPSSKDQDGSIKPEHAANVAKSQDHSSQTGKVSPHMPGPNDVHQESYAHQGGGFQPPYGGFNPYAAYGNGGMQPDGGWEAPPGNYGYM